MMYNNVSIIHSIITMKIKLPIIPRQNQISSCEYSKKIKYN